MELTNEERKYCNTLTKLYRKYGERIPNEELLQVNNKKGQSDICPQHAKELAEYSKNNAQKIEAVISAVQKSGHEKLSKLIKEPNDINKWKVTFWLSIGLLTSIFGIGIIIIIAELIAVFMHKRKQKHWTEFTLQVPVNAPGEINKWKVAFWYAIGLVASLFVVGIIVIIWETIVVWEHIRKLKRFSYITEIEAIVAMHKEQNDETTSPFYNDDEALNSDFEQTYIEESNKYMEQIESQENSDNAEQAESQENNDYTEHTENDEDYDSPEEPIEYNNTKTHEKQSFL